MNNNGKINSLDDKPFVPPIYNYVSSSANPLTWGEFSEYNHNYGHKVPSTKTVYNLY